MDGSVFVKPSLARKADVPTVSAKMATPNNSQTFIVRTTFPRCVRMHIQGPPNKSRQISTEPLAPRRVYDTVWTVLKSTWARSAPSVKERVSPSIFPDALARLVYLASKGNFIHIQRADRRGPSTCSGPIDVQRAHRRAVGGGFRGAHRVRLDTDRLSDRCTSVNVTAKCTTAAPASRCTI